MNRASEDQLNQLHGLLAEAWRLRLEEASNDPDKPLTAAEATSLAKFLADNGVKGHPNSPRMAPLKEGVDALEDLDGIADLSKYRTTR